MNRLLALCLCLAGLLFGAACAPLQAPTAIPDVTRVVSLQTPTPTPPPPTPTVTPTATPTLTPTPTPSPTPTAPPRLNFMAVGDVMLARSIGALIDRDGPAAPFAGVVSALSGADLLVGNLECAISDGGQPEPKAYVFRAPPAAAEALALAGFDLLSLANNHALDYGPAALADTRRLLAERGVATVGAGANVDEARAPVVIERGGLRAAFLGYVDVPVESRSGFDTRAWRAADRKPGLAWADVAHISADVAAARDLADVVIVMLHFGLEGRAQVTAAQRAQARAAIDAGAALVVGSHPHVLQPAETYNGGLIVYSLGNFVFDGFTFPENYSAVFTATLTRAGVEAHGWLPVVIERGLPRLATAEEAPDILARLQAAP